MNDQLKPSIIAGDADVATALATTLPHMSETIAALKAECHMTVERATRS